MPGQQWQSVCLYPPGWGVSALCRLLASHWLLAPILASDWPAAGHWRLVPEQRSTLVFVPVIISLTYAKYRPNAWHQPAPPMCSYLSYELQSSYTQSQSWKSGNENKLSTKIIFPASNAVKPRRDASKSLVSAHQLMRKVNGPTLLHSVGSVH